MDVRAKKPVIDLRLLGAGDRDLYHSLYSSSEVMRAIGPALATAEIDAQFERVLKHNQLGTPGHRAWAISERGGRERLGLASLLRDGGRAEFGVMLLPSAWRGGFLSATIAAFLPDAFGALGLDRIDVSRPDKRVAAMDRLLLPFGFQRTVGLRPGEVGWTLPADRWFEHSTGGLAT